MADSRTSLGQKWPLKGEKLIQAKALNQEWLKLGHIETSTSPWNSPIFIILKRSGQWRLLRNLRAINAVPDSETVPKILAFLKNTVAMHGMLRAPDKIQLVSPWKYLGYVLSERTIKPQKLTIDKTQLRTLNDFQKLLGDINCFCPIWGIPTHSLSNSYPARGPFSNFPLRINPLGYTGTFLGWRGPIFPISL